MALKLQTTLLIPYFFFFKYKYFITLKRAKEAGTLHLVPEDQSFVHFNEHVVSNKYIFNNCD